jgi:AraC family transcriptional regulator, ethanolamine operon transcriptional activator
MMPHTSQERNFMVNTKHTSDAFEQASGVLDWSVTYDQISSGKYKGWLMDAHIQNIQLFHEIFNQSLYQHGTCKDEKVAFGIAMKSEGQGSFWGNKLYQRDVAVLTGGEDIDFKTSHGLDMITMVLDRAELLEYADILGYQNVANKINARVLRAPQASEPLAITLSSLSQIISTSPDILHHENIQNSIKEAIFSSLLYFINAVDQEDTKYPANAYVKYKKVAEKAIAYMMANADRPVCMLELCRETAVSQRTLQYCFETVFNSNPINQLRIMRLNGLRRTLKMGGSEVSVQSAAETWGFWHLSRMAKEYKELFGELPSETLKTNPYLKQLDAQMLLP